MADQTRNPFDGRARTAFIVVAILLTVSGLGFQSLVNYLNVYLRKEPVHLREHFHNIPKTQGRWQAVGEDQILDAANVEALGTTPA